MKKTSIALCLFICLTLVSLLFLVGCKNDPEPQIEPEDNDIAGSLCMELVKGIASGAGGKIGDLVMGNLLSVFGFSDPEAGLSAKLDDIQDKLMYLSGSLQTVENQISGLRNYMASVEKTTLAEIDRSEFDTRMTVLNQSFAQIDALYDKYLRIARADDYETSKALADQLIADIEKSDLPSLLSQFRLEFYGGGAGAQRSLTEIYKEYLSKATTWTSQMMDDFNKFADYCETEVFRVGELYLEYCTYKQAQNADDEGQYKAWGSNALTARNNVTDAVNTADRSKLDTVYYCFNYGSIYHFANLYYGIDFCLDTNATYMGKYVNSGDWTDYHYVTTVPIEQFQLMDSLRAAVAGDKDFISFIESETGVSLNGTYVAGCIPNNGSAPIISLKTLKQDDQEWILDQDHFFRTWAGKEPLWDIDAK